MFNAIFGLVNMALMIPLMVVLYFVESYLIGCIARKKDPSFGMPFFFIPIYRYYALLEIYGLPIGLFIGLNVFVVALPLAYLTGSVSIIPLCYIVAVVSLGILWGRIAEAMGDNFGLWCFVGMVTAFSTVMAFLTPLIFAMSSCRPGGAGVIASGDAAPKKLPTTLSCIEGPLKDSSTPIKDGFKIGRAPEMDMVVPDPEISRLHATLSFIDGKLLLTDNSRNGTFMLKDGSKLRILKDAYLYAGDMFEIGTAPSRFVVK